MRNRKLTHPSVPLQEGMTASEWSLAWWKVRHENEYFPNMEWHKDWKPCPYPPPHFLELMQPTTSDRVLEIGCGYGEWMVPASPYCGTIAGFDIHPILEEKANELFNVNKITNAEFRLGDGKTIPFPDDEFTAIYSISVFQHIPRATVRGYFEEANRVLVAGGRVLFHFRFDDGVGTYSHDINVDHDGDFSTGWTVEEAETEAARVGWKSRVITDEEHSLFLYGVK